MIERSTCDTQSLLKGQRGISQPTFRTSLGASQRVAQLRKRNLKYEKQSNFIWLDFGRMESPYPNLQVKSTTLKLRHNKRIEGDALMGAPHARR